jgi:hypothetical protein
MPLKLSLYLTIVTTALFFNAKISLAESVKVPYVSISGFQAPLWLGEKAGAFRKSQLEATNLNGEWLTEFGRLD